MTWIQVRRAAKMTPVFIPLDKASLGWDTGSPGFSPRPEIIEWLEENVPPTDSGSKGWTFYHDNVDMSFYFTDAKVAMMFKLTWA